MFWLVLGDILIIIGVLFGTISCAIRRYVLGIQSRCTEIAFGTVDESSTPMSFHYQIHSDWYHGLLRPLSTASGYVRVKYNPCDYTDAYVIGDWNDLHRLHDRFVLCCMTFLFIGMIVSSF